MVNKAKIVINKRTSFIFDKVVALKRVFIVISSIIVNNAIRVKAVTAIEISAIVVILKRLRSAVSLIIRIDKIAVGVRQLL